MRIKKTTKKIPHSENYVTFWWFFNQEKKKGKKKKKHTWHDIKKSEKNTLCHIAIKLGWFYFFFSLFKKGYLVLSFHAMPHMLTLKMDGCGLWGLIYGGGILIPYIVLSITRQSQ
jgi:hypothetical protein